MTRGEEIAAALAQGKTWMLVYQTMQYAYTEAAFFKDEAALHVYRLHWLSCAYEYTMYHHDGSKWCETHGAACYCVACLGPEICCASFMC